MISHGFVNCGNLINIWRLRNSLVTPKYPKLTHFCIETHCDLGIPFLEAPQNEGLNKTSREFVIALFNILKNQNWDSIESNVEKLGFNQRKL